MVKKRPKSRPVRVSAASSVARDSPASESVDDEIFAALASVSQTAPVLAKICRLCQTKDGPFLNIFDADKVIAKRIEEVLPFTVAENDDLPHKICFRCSAKVEELYEFILKCIKTQESLQSAVSKKKTSIVTKSRFRLQWEKQLSKKNISNDDICNALIKKAMEGIKDIPINPLPFEDITPQRVPLSKTVKNIEPSATSKKEKEAVAMSSKTSIIFQSDEFIDPDDVKLKQVKLSIEKCDDKIPSTRSSRSNKPEAIIDNLEESSNKPRQSTSRKSHSKIESLTPDKPTHTNKVTDKSKPNNDHNSTIVNNDDKSDETQIAEKPKETPAKVPEPPPINIMDHVSIIKVNSVGTLYLCKLCNRNFLKQEFVLTHGCAKNNVPKFLHSHAPLREVPKPSTVKYIKMDKDFKKPIMTPVTSENKPAEKQPVPDASKLNTPVQSGSKPKPRIGPASKVKNLAQALETPKEPNPPPPKPPAQENIVVPEVQFPTIPSLNSRYKLVPGPNNTFTLVEDGQQKIENSSPPAPNNPGPKSKKRRKPMAGDEDDDKQLRPAAKVPSLEVIALDDVPSPPQAVQQPYPVGLFQTAHHSGVFPPTMSKPTFTTPAMKKQSYTIVQTGNPSKLLISTKHQPSAEEPQRKKSKKSKPDIRETNTEPYTVSVEDNSQAKDSGFFTFINVDPLLQPSYVLPTDNIIQESQISTSTPTSQVIVEPKEKDKYSCNMCQETFSREKKLLAHIQSHFNQMDEEDQLRKAKIGPKKKTRKS